jgi:dsRNA-specific ribonuclease
LQTEPIFPWAALTRLQAPKWFSDIVESVIGAVYLDSRGNLDVVRQLLCRIGIIPVLERIINDDVDVLHPVSRLWMWASKHEKKVEHKFEKDKGKVTCIILLDGKEEMRVAERHTGRASQEEVKFTASEEVIKKLKLSNDLRKKKKGTTTT